MSRLFGPFSVSKSSVSWRDCALAGDQIAGAGTAAAAVIAVIDLRKSRRFMGASQGWRLPLLWVLPQAACQAAPCGCGKINACFSGFIPFRAAGSERFLGVLRSYRTFIRQGAAGIRSCMEAIPDRRARYAGC